MNDLIDILKYEHDSLAVARGSDYSGVIAIEEAIQILSAHEDAVSRAAFKNEIDEYFKHIGRLKKRWGLSNGQKAIRRDMQGIVDNLPSVQPERKRGYWKQVTFSEATGYDPTLSGKDPLFCHVCSVCGEDAASNDLGDDLLTNFCPSCGAKMEDD